MKRIVVGVVALLASHQAMAQGWSAPPVGVYACHGQRGLAFPMMFGPLDEWTYANYDGLTGRYACPKDGNKDPRKRPW